MSSKALRCAIYTCNSNPGLAGEVANYLLCPSWVNTRINESERNRPKDLRNTTISQPPTREMLKRWGQLQEFVKQATSPGIIADVVFDEGIRQSRLYIVPHKEMAQYIRNRFDGIMKDI